MMFALTHLSVVMGLPLISSLLSAQQKEEILVTDVIRFYDKDCWMENCDDALQECQKADNTCMDTFTKQDNGPLDGLKGMKWKELSKPILEMMQCAKDNACTPDAELTSETVTLPGETAPKGALAELAPAMSMEAKGNLRVDDIIRNYDLKCWQESCEEATEDCVMNDPVCSQRFTIAMQQDNNTGGTPYEAFSGLKWKDMTTAMRNIVECAKSNGCTPDAQQVANTDSMPGLAGVEVLPEAAKKSSFVEVAADGSTNQLVNKKLLGSLAGADTRLADTQDAEKLAELATEHLHMIEAHQQKGLGYVANEKQFVMLAKAKMNEASARLQALRLVVHPTNIDMSELNAAAATIRDTKQQLANHFNKFHDLMIDHKKVDNLHQMMASFMDKGRKAYEQEHPNLVAARPAANLRSD